MNTNQAGKMTEVNVLSYLVNRGYSVSLPFGDKDRYDQIWDINNKLYVIPIDECSTEKKLRFSSKQPNQPSINWAKDYEFEEVIKRF